MGLGISAYRDVAPPGQPVPYVTITEGIALVFDGMPGYSDAAKRTGRETVQVDIWQTYRKKEDDTTQESPTLAKAIIRGLHGARLVTAPTVVYGVVVTLATRMVERDTNLVHTAITCEIHAEQ